MENSTAMATNIVMKFHQCFTVESKLRYHMHYINVCREGINLVRDDARSNPTTTKAIPALEPHVTDIINTLPSL